MPAQDYDLNDELTRERMREIAFSAAIGAGFLLFFAFYLGSLRGVSASGAYNFSVGVFLWTLRLGGAALGLVAVALWLGLRPALLVDAIATALIGLALIGIGVVWLVNRYWGGVLQLLFGMLFLRAARGSWGAYCGLAVMPGAQKGIEPDEDDGEELVPQADPAASQASINRLLAAKQRERKGEPARKVRPMARPVREMPTAPARAHAPVLQVPPEPESAPAAAFEAETDAQPAPAVVPEAAASQPAPATKSEPADTDEPPPEGFLAELGRDDH